MAFTVETGLGVPGANAYISVADADTHHADRGHTTWTDFTSPEKEVAIVRASDYIDKRFGKMFRGVRVARDQGLEWPRLDAFDDDGFLLTLLPAQLLKAASEYALRAAVCGLLAPDPILPVPKQDPTDFGNRPDQGVSGQITRDRTRIGPLEEEKWFETSSQTLKRNLGVGARRIQSTLVNDFQIPEYPEADLWLEELRGGLVA
jgi:hypothetical protein